MKRATAGAKSKKNVRFNLEEPQNQIGDSENKENASNAE